MTVRLRPMTVEDLPGVMVLEEELFAPDTWTTEMYRDELSRTDTRSYLVAEDEGAVVGYAGLIAYADEAHVATIGVAELTEAIKRYGWRDQGILVVSADDQRLT